MESTPRPHAGPHPGIVAIAFTALFIGGLVPVTLLVGPTHFPSPLQPPEEVVRYFQAEPGKVLLCAWLQFGSAVPLGIFTATMVSRLQHHGVRAAGVTIAQLGGFAAALAVALSALVQWTLAQPGIAADATMARALHFLTYAIGGPGYSVPVGLLFAGIAVTAGFTRLLPRWLVVFGVLLGAAGELSALSLVVPRALFLIPLTRFPGFVWMIAAGFSLPSRRVRAAA